MKNILLIVLFELFFANISYAITPIEMLEKIDEIRAPGKTFTFKLKVTILGSNSKKSETGFSVKIKDAYKSLVLYTSPPKNKGRVLLMVRENMWIYIPGTRRPIRISPQQQILSGVSNADVARVVFSLDYEPESAEEDNIEDKAVLKLVLNGKNKGAAYKKVILWVEKNTYRPIKGEFFATSGRLLKVTYFKGYKLIHGKEIPTILEIHDTVKKSEVTLMEYSDINVEDTPDMYFQKTFMERIR